MKLTTLRNRVEAMRDRWERDLDALDRMFPEGGNWHETSGAVVETKRNLATAIGQAGGISGMSDEYLERAHRGISDD